MKKICNYFLMVISFVIVFLFLGNGLCLAKQKNDGDVFRLKRMSSGHYAADLMINDSVPAKGMFVGGEVLSVSAEFYYKHPNLFNLKMKPAHSSIHDFGKNKSASYRSEGTVKIGPNTYFIGTVWIINDIKTDIYLPLKNIYNEKDNYSQIICLDFNSKKMAMYTKQELDKRAKRFRKFFLTKSIGDDDYSIQTTLFVRDTTGFVKSLTGMFDINLGFGGLVWLHKGNSNVERFLRSHPFFKLRDYSERGAHYKQYSFTADECEICGVTYGRESISVMEPKYQDDKIVGNLGTGFFERSLCIFDYDNMIVYAR